LTVKKALLIGVSSYSSDDISNLPMVNNDIKALDEVLTQSEYQIQAYNSQSDTTRSKIILKIAQFLEECRPDDLAIIYLSGHGLHLNGKNYFIPSDAEDLKNTPAVIAQLLVEISFENLINDSKALTVVLIVDACREGVVTTPPDKSKSTTITQWGHETKEDSKNKEFICVFSCSSGQLSQFEVDESGLSIFTRALVNILAPDHRAQNLGEVLEALGPETTRICDKENLLNQKVKVIGELTSGGYQNLTQKVCTNKTENIGELYKRIKKSTLWGSAVNVSPSLLTPIKQEVEKLALWCSAVKPNKINTVLPSFHDSNFFLRCMDRLELLLFQTKPKLSGLELATIFSALLLAELHYLKITNQFKINFTSDGVENDPVFDFLKKEQNFERYRAFSKAFLDPDTKEKLITDYSFEWAYCHATNFNDNGNDRYIVFNETDLDNLISNLDFLKDVGVGILQKVASCFIRAECIKFLPKKRTFREGAFDEQDLSADILGEVSYLSGRMAIHIGSFSSGFAALITANKPVIPSSIVSILNKVKWVDRSSLSVECDNSVLDELLQQHINYTNSRMIDFQNTSLRKNQCYQRFVKGFTKLDSKKLNPSITDGQASYIKPLVKIRLEDNKMRDLLMGDQLYGNSNLALRELYQNAQDACQIRKARVDYLNATNKSPTPWQPKISIRLSYDETGQGFIECEDNGSGMSLDLLKNCFTFAGHKLTDTSLFIQEQQQWKSITPSIKAQLISRFGIGVLSYFMLSNEIHVHTRHFTSSGELSDTAYSLTLYMSSEVTSISYSNKLKEGGTIVRLMLRPEVISDFDIDQLFDSKEEDNLNFIFKQFLGSNCFQLQLSENNKVTNYPSGSLLFESKKNILSFLNKRAIPNKININRETSEIAFSDHAIAYKEPTTNREYKSNNGEVWFYEYGEGYLLADGILTDITYPYVTVNLVGEESPRLSVDRKHVQDLDKSLIEKKLLASISDVLNAPWITADWIWSFLEKWPSLGDQLYRAIHKDFKEKAFPLRLPIDKNNRVLHIKLSKCGLFSPDRDLIPILDGGLPVFFNLSPTLTISRLRALKDAIEDKSYAVMGENKNNNVLHDKDNLASFWQKVLSKALSKKCNDTHPWVYGEIDSLVIIKLAVTNKIPISDLTKEFIYLEASTGAFINKDTATKLAELHLDDICIQYIQKHVKLGWNKVVINKLKLMKISIDMRTSVKKIIASLEPLEKIGVISFSKQAYLVEDILFQEKDIQVFIAITLGIDLSKSNEDFLQNSLLFDKKRILAGSGKAQISIAETLEVCEKIAKYYNVNFHESFNSSTQIIAPKLTQYLIAKTPDDTTKLLESEFSASHILRFCSHYLISLDLFVKDFSFIFEEFGSCDSIKLAQESGYNPLLMEDRRLVSLKLNGKRPWVSGKVPEAHILQASNELNIPINKLLTKMKLWEKAFRITSPKIELRNNNMIADDLVVKALSRNLNGSHPWVSIEKLANELVIRAFLLDTPCNQLISSCGEYFCEIKEANYKDIHVGNSPASIVKTLKEFALHQMQSGINSLFPIKIPTISVCKISVNSGFTIDKTLIVVKSLPKLFTLDESVTNNINKMPTDDQKHLIVNLSNIKNKESSKGKRIFSTLILNIAAEHEDSPEKVVSYIQDLKKATGLIEGEIPSIKNLDNPLTKRDVVILSKNCDPSDSWLSGKVDIGHIIYASSKLKLSIETCINTVKRYEVFLGLKVDKDVEALNPARVADRFDVYLISQYFDGKPPWKSSIGNLDLEFASMVLDVQKSVIDSSYERLFIKK
jgi:hypothetical protein